MSHKALTSILLLGVFANASAQVHVDAQPVSGEQPAQEARNFRIGLKFSAVHFQPASTFSFTANDADPVAAQRSATAQMTSAPIGRVVKHVPHKSAAVHYSYTASGTEREGQARDTWNMKAGTLGDGQKALLDVIPDCFEAGGIAVPYSQEAGTLIIEPTYLGSTSQYHVFLFAYDDSWSNFDLRITLDGNGAMTVAPDLNIVYGAFTTDYFDINSYQGYYESYSNVGYKKDVVVGDANEDSVVDKSDTQTLVGHLLGRSQENADADAMDTNADGNINVADVIGLSNIIKTKK